jgi:hypothetical protein
MKTQGLSRAKARLTRSQAPQRPRKGEKLEAIIEMLQTSSFPNVSITALRSMESLCDTLEKTQRFTLFLAEKKFASKKAKVKLGEKALMERSVKAMQAKLKGEGGESIRTIHTDSYRYQNEIQRLINGYSVRLIKCEELLLMEVAMESFLYPSNPKHGYAVARQYVEQWTSRSCVGIIPESIPALKDVIGFWEEEFKASVEPM